MNLKTPLFAMVAVAALSSTNALAGDASGRSIAVTCWGCHGTDGVSAGAAPSLKGLSAERVTTAMNDFASGKRPGTIMMRIAKGYNANEIKNLADYISSMK